MDSTNVEDDMLTHYLFLATQNNNALSIIFHTLDILKYAIYDIKVLHVLLYILTTRCSKNFYVQNNFVACKFLINTEIKVFPIILINFRNSWRVYCISFQCGPRG